VHLKHGTSTPMLLVIQSHPPPVIRSYTLSSTRSPVPPTTSSGARAAGVEPRAEALTVALVRYPFTCLSLPFIHSPSDIGESCGSTSGKTSRVSLGSGGLPNGKTSTTSSGAGRCGSAPIPLGQPFAGRITTHGKREEVHENRYVICMGASWNIGTAPFLTRVICALEVHTGAATRVWWVHMASRGSASHSSGQSFGLVLRSAQAHTCVGHTKCVST
jgi:hypothetical protein